MALIETDIVVFRNCNGVNNAGFIPLVHGLMSCIQKEASIFHLIGGNLVLDRFGKHKAWKAALIEKFVN